MGRSVVISLVSLGACAALAGRVLAEPMGTAFTYQARIERGGSPVGGSHDFLFSLYDAPTGPGQIGSSASKQDQQVDNGYLTVQLDWPDSDAFNGNARWLEIAVRPGEFNDPCVYTVISPRQKVTPTPYALYAASSGQTANSVDGSGTVNHVAKFVDTNTVGDSAVYESGGNVGIGTTSPQRLLHMVGVNPRVLIEASSSSPEVNLKSSDDSASETWSIYKNSGTNGLEFYQNGTKMMIQSGTGNVGVGTSSPDAKLSVGGTGSPGIGLYGEGSALGYGVFGEGSTGVSGSGTTYGVWGTSSHEAGHFLATGAGGIGVNALAATSSGIGVEGRNMISQNVGKLGSDYWGAYGENGGSGNSGALGGPDYGIKCNGDLVVVDGAYRGYAGLIGLQGAPFPREAYDSGWVSISAGQTLHLTHNIGGDPDDYFVDLMIKGPGGLGITNKRIGRDWRRIPGDDETVYKWGFYWKELTSTSIGVRREVDDDTAGTVRIRIWRE